MEIPLLKDILIIFGLSTIVIFFCHKLKIPTTVGYLATGILCGPYGLKLVNDSQEVEILAQVGIVLLLFSIGIEFSIRNLWQMKKGVLLGGFLQVLLTIVSTYVLMALSGLPVGKSIFVGFLVSLSSTAIVLRVLQEKNDIHSPHGKLTLAILIFQDIIIVPMMLFTPLIAGARNNIGESFALDLLAGIAIIVLLIASAKWFIPRVLYQVARTKDRELFLLVTVVVCLAVAWLTSSAGLSLALGAFLAGLIISESEYSHVALNNILPFKNVFTSLFFVSVGMLLDTEYFFEQSSIILLMTLGIMLLKFVVSGATSSILGLPFRTNILVGIGLCQVGEFSFILSKEGLKYGLLDNDLYQIFLAVSIITMAITPFLMNFAPETITVATKLPLPAWFKTDTKSVSILQEKNKDEAKIKNHMIIIGFGLTGKNLRDAAKIEEIPYIAIDTNPENVNFERSCGEPVYYGDATQESVLESANIKKAKVVVISVSDLYATNLITRNVRYLNPSVYIIVRTKFFKQTKIFLQLGANEVVSDEIQASVEVLSRTLKKYGVKKDKILSYVDDITSYVDEMKIDRLN